MSQNGFMYLFLNCWLHWVIAVLWAFSSCRERGSSLLRPLIAVASLVGCFPGGSDGKVSACNVGDRGSIPGLGRSPGEGNGNPLQYSCWRIPWTEKTDELQSMGSQRVGHD